jgi:hypothetical protein
MLRATTDTSDLGHRTVDNRSYPSARAVGTCVNRGGGASLRPTDDPQPDDRPQDRGQFPYRILASPIKRHRPPGRFRSTTQAKLDLAPSVRFGRK